MKKIILVLVALMVLSLGLYGSVYWLEMEKAKLEAGWDARFEEVGAQPLYDYEELKLKVAELENELAKALVERKVIFRRINVLLGKLDRTQQVLDALVPGDNWALTVKSMDALEVRMRKLEDWLARDVDKPSWCPGWLGSFSFYWLGQERCEAVSK